MNSLDPAPEVFRPRWLTPHLRQAVVDHRVVVLTGARQVGKSTLLRQEEPFRGWRYHTLGGNQAGEPLGGGEQHHPG